MYLELMTINESAPPMTGSCSAAADPAYWDCRIDGRALSVESGDLVQRHLHVRLHKGDDKVDLASLSCDV